MSALLGLALLLLLNSCVAGTIQGQIGFSELDTDAIDLNDQADDVTDGGVSTLPTLGFAVQLPGIGGEHLNLGIEWGATGSWESDRGAVIAGNGTVVVFSENDYLLADGFVGLYINANLGPNWRVYGGAGPLLQYGSVDLEYRDELNNLNDVGGDAFGVGAYVRTGIERTYGPTTVGIGARWITSSIEPGGGIDDVDLEGIQFLITATQRL